MVYTALSYLLIAGNLQSNQETEISIEDNVPAGFEALVEEQNLFVDVYFNGRNIGATEVIADVDSITFSDAEDLASKLENVKKNDQLVSFLSEKLDTNADKICFARNQPEGCGQVVPNPVAIIYNEYLLEIELFIARELQLTQALSIDRYLPTANSIESSIVSLNAVASDNNTAARSLDVSSRLQLAYGAGFFNTELDYNTRGKTAQIRHNYYKHLFKDYSLTLGTQTYETGALFNNLDVLGATFESSTQTRVDLAAAFGSELTIYLPRRSQVKLIVNDRVYLAKRYPAGNQEIDTRYLPNGTYEIDIVVNDPVTGEQRERRLFTKSTDIPPRGPGQFKASFGVPLAYSSSKSLPDHSSTLIGGFSYTRRLTDQSSWRLSMLTAESRAYGEADFQYLGSRTSLKLSFNLSSHGAKGGTFRLSHTAKSFSTSISAQRFLAKHISFNDSFLDQAISDSFDQVSATLSKSFHRTSLIARVNYRRVNSDLSSERRSRQFSTTLRREIFRLGKLRSNVEFSYTQDAINHTIRANISVSHNRTSAASTRLLFGQESENREAQQPTLDVSHREQIDTLNGVFIEGELDAASNETGELVGVGLELQHANYTISLSNNWNNNTSESANRETSAQLSTHLGFDRYGVALGGSDSNQSGMIISIKGEPEHERYDIIIDGVKQGTTRVGKTQFIGLPSLRSYNVQLLSETALSSTLEQDSFSFTLYPGMVTRVSTKAHRKVLLITTLVDDKNSLIQNATVHSEVSTFQIGEEGFVEMELSPNQTYHVTRPNKAPCRFTVPDARTQENVLVMADPLSCSTGQKP